MNYVRIRTKNSTAAPLRKTILVDDWAVVRLGSLTPIEEIFPDHFRDCIEINTPEAIRNSSSKLRMKRCFATKEVPQAKGWTTEDKKTFYPIIGDGAQGGMLTIDTLPYPIVAKQVWGCQGQGMELINDMKSLKKWLKKAHTLNYWIFEEFYNYGCEYRLHVARGIGVFMSWRKLRRAETIEADRWFFNNSNSNWVGPGHELFNKPACWKAMVKAAKDALDTCGLDVGACDIRTQTSKVKNPKFIVCEINSAPSLGEMGIEEYKKIIPKLINIKKNGSK